MFRTLLSRRFTSFAVPSIATAITLSYDHETHANGLSHASIINDSNVVVLSGSANLLLSQQIADILKTPLLDVTTKRFSDGEINCVINESIRGKDVFIIQTCAAPVNDNVMELLLTVAAARRAGANTVTTVIPYFGYKYHRRYSNINVLKERDSSFHLNLSVILSQRASTLLLTDYSLLFLNYRGLPISTTYSSRFLWNSAGGTY
jgi:N-terminal domain of ribose phosphate pyrophosphokinase